jgi:hypothetical protein
MHGGEKDLSVWQGLVTVISHWSFVIRLANDE